MVKSNSKQYKKDFLEILHKVAKDPGLLENFMIEILTPREYDNISVRWEIVKRLAKGEHHQSIAEDLHLGVATVTRGSRELRKKNGGLWEALKLIKNKK